MSESVPPGAPPPPRRKFDVKAYDCICLHMGRKRVGEDPECPVTFHNDRVDEIFDEIGVTSQIFDKLL